MGIKNQSKKSDGKLFQSDLIRVFLCAVAWIVFSPYLLGHDLWVEINQPITRLGEKAIVSLKLGNCDDGKPDFKVAGTLPKESVQAFLVSTTNEKQDLSKSIYATHSDPAMGFWCVNVESTHIGTHWIVHRLDELVDHDGIKRGIMFAKSPWVVAESTEDTALVQAVVGFSQPFEIVLLSSPLPSLESQRPIIVKVLRNGVEIPNHPISFTMIQKDDSPESTEVVSDGQGSVEFHPKEPGLCLISSRLVDESESGRDFRATYYSSTICLHVSKRKLGKGSGSW